MKVLMLNPPFLPKFSREQRSPAVTKSGTLYYPMWLAYATGVLEEAGFDVRLVDAPAQGKSVEEILELVRDLQPAVAVMEPKIYQQLEQAGLPMTIIYQDPRRVAVTRR